MPDIFLLPFYLVGFGLVSGILAAFFGWLILHGIVSCPPIERRIILPWLRVATIKAQGQPMPPKIEKYLDRARARGLLD